MNSSGLQRETEGKTLGVRLELTGSVLRLHIYIIYIIDTKASCLFSFFLICYLPSCLCHLSRRFVGCVFGWFACLFVVAPLLELEVSPRALWDNACAVVVLCLHD